MLLKYKIILTTFQATFSLNPPRLPPVICLKFSLPYASLKQKHNTKCYVQLSLFGKYFSNVRDNCLIFMVIANHFVEL